MATLTMTMTSILDKAKSKLPGRKSSKSPSQERSIPPEPVQQQPHGNFLDAELEPALQEHNLARANKSCAKLEWDAELAKNAEAYAKTLAEKGEMKHSGTEGQGENLYMSTGEATFEDAVKSWLAEERQYHGEMVGEGEFGKWGHFSQCLWHSTTHVGMGKARTKEGATYIVGRYTPPGNMSGERPF